MSNTQPRPESFREDYVTANNESYYATSGIIYPATHALNESERATLYANLATGAESGWDYTSRWIANPRDAVDDVYFPLRSLNTANIVGVDLNSILYANERTIAGYLEAAGNHTGAADFAQRAEERAAAMYALMWNPEEFAYFDYNLTSASQNVYVPADADILLPERRLVVKPPLSPSSCTAKADYLVAVWRPCQCKGLLADLDLTDASLGANVPEPNHTIGTAACELILVDGVEGHALEVGKRRHVGSTKLCRILDVCLLGIPYAQCLVCSSRGDKSTRSIPGYGADVVRRGDGGWARAVLVDGGLEFLESRLKVVLLDRTRAEWGRHLGCSGWKWWW